MPVTPYTKEDFEGLLEALKRLTDKQKKLAEALILLGLTATTQSDPDVLIQLQEPDEGERTESLPLSEAFDYFLTHGALHVCGWDHAEAVEAAAMRAVERRLLGDVPA